MLTKLTIRKFKRFDNAVIELGNPVVFVGPNNSGKTTALQAFTLWEIGLQKWRERRGDEDAPKVRSGVVVNRRDLVTVPVPAAKLLWFAQRTHTKDGSVKFEIELEGVAFGKLWSYGLEFEYANEESFYCRPLKPDGGRIPPIPDAAKQIHFASLPPMSGLVANETRVDEGKIRVILGEGRSAEVLRNLCYRLYDTDRVLWQSVVDRMQRLFGVKVNDPKYLKERGEIAMSFVEDRCELDLSSSGRGFQQMLLLLTYLRVFSGSIVLLDEPDAHLEFLRQRHVYGVLSEAAKEAGNQIVVGSHSEVLLNEAADRDVVVAFIGKSPHRIDDRGSQLLKSLKEIGFDQYALAEQTGWVLYLEGATDLAILQTLADQLDHPAKDVLERPFVHYVANQPIKARDHFHALKEAKRDLVGVAIFDRLSKEIVSNEHLKQLTWSRRELENYIVTRESLGAWVRSHAEKQFGSLFVDRWEERMGEEISRLESSLSTLFKSSPWSPDIKVTDDFLDPLFRNFFESLGLGVLFRKSDYHELARFVRPDQLDPEIIQKLDEIAETASRATPAV